jgi:hypothetical protein
MAVRIGDSPTVPVPGGANGVLGSASNTRRGLLIARTEVTGSLNAGHYAAIGDLAETGVVKKKEWNTTLDQYTRDSHLKLHDTKVATNANFDVGGHSAPYPGHFSLPAKERCHCRCSLLSVIDDALMQDPPGDGVLPPGVHPSTGTAPPAPAPSAPVVIEPPPAIIEPVEPGPPPVVNVAPIEPAPPAAVAVEAEAAFVPEGMSFTAYDKIDPEDALQVLGQNVRRKADAIRSGNILQEEHVRELGSMVRKYVESVVKIPAQQKAAVVDRIVAGGNYRKVLAQLREAEKGSAAEAALRLEAKKAGTALADAGALERQLTKKIRDERIYHIQDALRNVRDFGGKKIPMKAKSRKGAMGQLVDDVVEENYPKDWAVAIDKRDDLESLLVWDEVVDRGEYKSFRFGDKYSTHALRLSGHAKSSQRSCAVHEVGHLMTEQVANTKGRQILSDIERQFFSRRTKGQAVEVMNGDESTIPDKFFDRYCGRVYDHDSREIVSMGMEYLFDPNVTMNAANKLWADTEYTDLILGMLAGM